MPGQDRAYIPSLPCNLCKGKGILFMIVREPIEVQSLQEVLDTAERCSKVPMIV